jgi:diguanylate cyclase (GGDEF)-like protein
MIEAQIPSNENERLKALHKLQLLDTPIEERFERITRLLCRLLDVPISSFTLVDEFRQWFKSIQGLTSLETPRRIAFCSHAVLSNEMLVVSDATKDERFFDNPLVTGAPYIGSYVGHRIRSSDGYSIGTICAIDHKPRHFNQDQMQLMRDMAAIVETELRVMEFTASHKQLIQELDTAEKLALIDPLTRIWNRAGIMKILQREWAEASRSNNFIGILSADIDHFKRINDTYGHPAGDAVIRETSRIMLSSLRHYDAVGRIGGEEFLAVLPGALPEQLHQVASRMMEALQAGPIKADRNHMIPVTASFGGIVVIPDKDHTIDVVLSTVDKALYRAKEKGRNRVEIDDIYHTH